MVLLTRRFVSLGLLGCGALVGLSCGSGGDLNPVQGVVRHAGKPLAGALVSFHADGSATTSVPPTALTKEDGTFSVSTGESAGAPAGTYTVTVIHSVPVKRPPDGSMSMGDSTETEDSLKGAYADRATSQIKVTIKDGANQLEPFDLK